MDITFDDLFKIIGRKQVEIEMLRDQNRRIVYELNLKQDGQNSEEGDVREDIRND